MPRPARRQTVDGKTGRNAWPAQNRASCLVRGLYEVQYSLITKRNLETFEWSLVATRDLAVGTFLGFYSGRACMDCTERTVYGLKVTSAFVLLPFDDERNITFAEREARPLACMNEPTRGETANCCMVPQDFARDEVDGVAQLADHEKARYFRGIACFTCREVQAGEELTWHYGPSYAPHREEAGYEVGADCPERFENDPRRLLRAMRRVPHTCVVPVWGALHSQRFGRRSAFRPRTDEGWSSGSGHAAEYVPDPLSREERLRKRRRE